MEIDLSKLTPDIRHLNDARGVLYDQDFAKNSPDMDLYFMYRGLEQKNNLRYDITLIPSKILGKEFNKTKGHYHVGKWQELYIVLEGKAIYLLQKKNEKGEIEDVFAVHASKGECVIMPPSYGHVTINPSETEELKMANWISEDCKSDYSDYEKNAGACYFYTKDGNWVKNPNYKNIPDLRFEEPLKEIPQNLDFLK